MTNVKDLVAGLEEGHTFYSMDISGFPQEHKDFLVSHLETLLEYRWLDDPIMDEPLMECHFLLVRNDPRNIREAVENLMVTFEGTDIPATAPLFSALDPDARAIWKKNTVRELFNQTYGG